MLTFLKLLFALVWLFMVFMVVSTSLESSLFKEWDYLASIPWMRATLWDFYANILVIFIWVAYRENKLTIKVFWAVLFFCLGSIASIGYLLIQLFTLKEGDNIQQIFQPKRK